MMKKNKIFQICAVGLIIDQFIKFLVTYNMKLGSIITIIPNFFEIYYLQNKGAAFSSFQGMRYVLILVSLIIFFGMLIHIKNTNITNKVEIISLGFIMGGLIGNLIDRILYSYVIDYLSFTFFGYSFAVFNFADSLIVIGVILLVIEIIRSDINEYKSRRRKD